MEKERKKKIRFGVTFSLTQPERTCSAKTGRRGNIKVADPDILMEGES